MRHGAGGTPLLALQSIDYSTKLLKLFLELQVLPSEINVPHENDRLNPRKTTK